MSKVTVIGAGNGGVTAAYHFARLGHDVCIYDDPKFDTQIKAIREKGGIEALAEEHGCQMEFPGFSKIELATTDIKEAMEFANIFVMVCPSFAQEVLFNSMMPYLKEGDTILLMPGNYGGLVLSKMLKDNGKEQLNITIVDTVTIPWACRLVSPGVITIMGIKKLLPISVIPNKNKKKLEKKLMNILSIQIEVLDNVVTAGLDSFNFGGHPLLTTLNMGLLENFNGEFNYYRDCSSPATARAAVKMDEERLAVGRALGLKLRTELEADNDYYGVNYKTAHDFNRASVVHAKINNAPNSSKSRYITEDVPYLLVPCYEFAKLCGIKVPIVESCINIASAYNDIDYFTTGRTLEKMGLIKMDVKDIMKYISSM